MLSGNDDDAAVIVVDGNEEVEYPYDKVKVNEMRATGIVKEKERKGKEQWMTSLSGAICSK